MSLTLEHTLAGGRRGLRNARRIRLSLLLLLVATAGAVEAADTVLVPRGATWSYLDNGSNQGTAWRAVGFNASSWAQGPAELGYGDGGEATTVSFGPTPRRSSSPPTSGARSRPTESPRSRVSSCASCATTGPSSTSTASRCTAPTCPAGAVSFTTPASTALGGADESTFFETALSPSALVEGTNVLAVEIHQSGPTSTDISFNLELVASDTVERNARSLSAARDTRLHRRALAHVGPTDSRVVYGSTLANLDVEVYDATPTTDHVVAARRTRSGVPLLLRRGDGRRDPRRRRLAAFVRHRSAGGDEAADPGLGDRRLGHRAT